MSKNTNNNYYANLILNNEISNHYCVDCGKENPTHVSINNGVTLCQDCSDIHLNLGLSVSYIRLLYGKWDSYLYKYFLYGGNANFNNMLKMFSIDNVSYDINTKYKTNAAVFYRKVLMAKVEGDDIDMNSNFYEGNIKSENVYDYKSENVFFDYQIDNKGKFEKIVGAMAKKVEGIGKQIDKIKRKARTANITNMVKGIFGILGKKRNKSNKRNSDDMEID